MELLISNENICHCGIKLKTKKYLKEHRKFVHTFFKGFDCKYCKKVYKYKRGLTRHIKTIHMNSLKNNFSD